MRNFAQDNRKLIGDFGLGGVGGNIGGVFSDVTGASQQQAASAKESKLNRKFQKMMSDTAHAREVADLRKAGLNPILSANTGATTPPGSTGAMSKADPGSFMQGISSAAQLKASISNIKANTQNTLTNSALNQANTGKAIAEKENIINTTRLKDPFATAAEFASDTMSVTSKGLGHAYDLADKAAGKIEGGLNYSAKSMKSGFEKAMKGLRNLANTKGSKWKAIYDGVMDFLPVNAFPRR